MRCQLAFAVLALAAIGTVTADAGRARCTTTTAARAYASDIRLSAPLVPKLALGLRAPGLSLAVAVDGRVVWSVNCGLADLRRERRVRDTTRFRIGSVSKTLTAALLAREAELGAVDLDAPISRCVPSFRPHAGITLRRLAGHLAGIRHYETAAEVDNRRHFTSVQESVAIFRDDPLVAPPGTRFSYSTYGYDLIGACLERASGDGFARLARDLLLRPAGLVSTGFAGRPSATFYELTDAGDVRVAPPIDLSDRLPGGGLLSNARDLARFGSLLAEGRVVSAESAKTMFTSQRTTAGERTGYGLGLEVHPSAHGLFVGHTGSVVGGTAALVIHPARHAALAVATNVGAVTAAAPPAPGPGTPDPPQLLLPFLR